MLPEEREKLVNEAIKLFDDGLFDWDLHIRISTLMNLNSRATNHLIPVFEFMTPIFNSNTIIESIIIYVFSDKIENIEIKYCDDRVSLKSIYFNCGDRDYFFKLKKCFINSLKNDSKIFDNIKDILTAQVDKMAEVSKKDILNMFVEDNGATMSNMESLYKSFKYYFDYDKKKIKYFLDVLKNVKEDKWEYETKTEKYGVLYYSIHKTEVLKYNNIKIVCKNNHYDNLEDADTDFIIIVYVGNRKIFETDDETSELAIEIIDFIERVERRAKEQK